MWKLVPLDAVQTRYEKLEKKWHREIVNVFDNLDTLVKALVLGAKPEQLKKLSFVHSEPLGLLAIDQKGPSKGARLKPFRLYVYPHEATETLYIITLGDKDTQNKDIQEAKVFIQGLLRGTVQTTQQEAREGTADGRPDND